VNHCEQYDQYSLVEISRIVVNAYRSIRAIFVIHVNRECAISPLHSSVSTVFSTRRGEHGAKAGKCVKGGFCASGGGQVPAECSKNLCNVSCAAAYDSSVGGRSDGAEEKPERGSLHIQKQSTNVLMSLVVLTLMRCDSSNLLVARIGSKPCFPPENCQQ
jgi:hypothetical protein